MTSSSPTLRLSVIIPAYNEASRIRPTLEEYTRHFTERYGDAVEVVVVLNGCTDDTRAVVQSVMAHAPQVRVLEFAAPLGKGGAVYEGFQSACGEYLAFADADNMVRAPETERLVKALDQHDLAIANRFNGRRRDAGQSFRRRVMSKVVRLWVRRVLGLRYQDTQCGAKAIRASAWRAVAPRIQEKGWTFDLDLLIWANRLGLRVAEVPVAWRHVEEGSKVRAWQAGMQLLASARLRWRRR